MSPKPPRLVDSRASRRDFLRQGAGVLLASHPLVAALDRSAPAGTQRISLKSQAQYRSEAAEYEGAVQSLASSASMPAATDADITRITNLVAGATPKLDLHHSWMVAACIADSNLVAWVRKEIRDQASFDRFINDVKRDPKIVDAIAGLGALRATLDQMNAQKRALIQQIAAKEREIAGLEAAGAAAQRAKEAQECQKTWAIVTAIVVIVIAIVVAIVSSGVAGLAAAYQGTGADLAAKEFQSANQRYQQCVSAAATLPPAKRARAIAECQARWLAEKAVYIG